MDCKVTPGDLCPIIDCVNNIDWVLMLMLKFVKVIQREPCFDGSYIAGRFHGVDVAPSGNTGLIDFEIQVGI